MKSSWENRLTIKDLLKAFEESGYPKSESWIKRQENKGNLILPKSLTDFRKPRGIYKIGFVTEFHSKKQLKEIVKEFSPGGSGFWSYKD